jgi:hypothetical protein
MAAALDGRGSRGMMNVLVVEGVRRRLADGLVVGIEEADETVEEIEVIDEEEEDEDEDEATEDEREMDCCCCGG